MQFHVYWLPFIFILFINGGGLSVGQIENTNMMVHRPCIDKERQALLVFKASLIDPDGILDDWGNKEENKDCCNWVGVRCSDESGHVMGLEFSTSTNLAGKISPSLAQLHQLQLLILGKFDFQFNHIPNVLGSLSNLLHLDISSSNLTGPIPHQLANLSNLLHLDLSHNNLTGHLPISVGQIFDLMYLDVSSNSLNGVISDLHFLNLSYLTYLDLSFNSFSFELKSIPSQLETIKLQSCRLGPRFPSWLKTQSNFKHLDISNAGISDILPVWFWDLPGLMQYLNLSSNNIRGMLPDTTPIFFNYPGMDLSSNQIEGGISHLPFKLASLNLSGNKFSGTLAYLCDMDDALNFLDLSNNSFLGSLPDCWLKFQKSLIILNLSNNNLSGEIPSSLGFLSNLQALYLRTNAFFGELPTSLSQCTKLRFVDLGENKLSGSIPEWLGERVTDLYVLVLRSNRFHGSLPTQICWLYNLQLLDLSKNGLSGNVPRCFGNFSAMATRKFRNVTNHSYSSYAGTIYVPDSPNPGHYFGNVESVYVPDSPTPRKHVGNVESVYVPQQLPAPHGRQLRTGRPAGPCFEAYCSEEALFVDNAWVAWKGTERSFGRSGLQLLKSIDLSSNNLSGKFPYEIASLFELVSLNFSINKLHGEIPKEMDQLKSLESLDLSRNEFSGHIPWSLSRLNFLSYLDLSENNLSGSIPTGPQLQRFNSSSYNGNLHLCGLPLPKSCGLTPPTTTTNKEDDEEDESEVLKWYHMGMGVGFAVGFWGICGVIFLNRGCRHFLFTSLNHVNDWIYITIAVYLWKFKRF